MMHHDPMPGTTMGTIGGTGSTLFAMAKTATGESPWWLPLACCLLTTVPAIMNFVDRRLTARDARRSAAITAAAVAAAQAAAPVKSDVTVTLVADSPKA